MTAAEWIDEHLARMESTARQSAALCADMHAETVRMQQRQEESLRKILAASYGLEAELDRVMAALNPFASVPVPVAREESP